MSHQGILCEEVNFEVLIVWLSLGEEVLCGTGRVKVQE